MLEEFYDSITRASLDLQTFGENTFELNKSSTLGFVGIALQDTRTLLVGLQNILATHLGKPALKLDLSSPQNMNTPNDFLSAMKSVHRHFFISILTGLDAAAQRICEQRQIRGVKSEKAFRRALSGLQKQKQDEWRFFYQGLKIMRNECAHVSINRLHSGQLKKLNDAGLGFLVVNREISINCQKYLPVAERATACIRDLQHAKDDLGR